MWAAHLHEKATGANMPTLCPSEVFVTSWTREHGLPPSLTVCCVVWQALGRIADKKSLGRVVGILSAEQARVYHDQNSILPGCVQGYDRMSEHL